MVDALEEVISGLEVRGLPTHETEICGNRAELLGVELSSEHRCARIARCYETKFDDNLKKTILIIFFSSDLRNNQSSK